MHFVLFFKSVTQKNFFTQFPLGLTTSFQKIESFRDKIKNSKIEKEIVSNKLQFISQDWKGIENSRVKRLKKLDVAPLNGQILLSIPIS